MKIIYFFFKFKNDEDKRSQFFIQKIRNLLHESNCFSVSTKESLSSHIFRAAYSINSYKNIEIEKIRAQLGHKYIHTTLNSCVNLERRKIILKIQQ